MGRGIVESGLFRNERIEIEIRTTDPSSPANGEMWFRDDLDADTEKFGELRWYDGSSINAAPVSNTGTSGSDVEEVWRLQTPDGLGFVPLASRSTATYQQISFQHGGSILGLHDSTTAISSSVIEPFSENNLDAYAGDTGAYGTQNNQVYDSNYALIKSSSNSSWSAITRTDETLQQGDLIDWRYHGHNSTGFRGGLAWGVQAETGAGSLDAYSAHLHADSDSTGDFRISIWENGSKTDLLSESVSQPGSEWIKAEVDWQTDGTMVLTVYDSNGNKINSGSATDTTYTSGGFGWVFFDADGAADWARRNP